MNYNYVKHLRYEWEQARDEGFYVNDLYIECNAVDIEVCTQAYVEELTNKLYKCSQYEAYYEPNKIEDIIKECSYNISDMVYSDYDLKIRGALMMQRFANSEEDFSYLKNYSTLYSKDISKISGYNVVEHWLNNFTYASLNLSQQVAYRNYFLGVELDQLATTYNPYREWNGGLVDALIIGLINPANPMNASKLAYLVNYPTHTKNGLYGPMLVSGIIAQCFVNTDIIELIKTGISVIPNGSRLSEAINEVIDAYENQVTVESLMRSIRKRFDNSTEFGMYHVIANTMIITLCVLYAKTYEEAIKLCSELGFDVQTNIKVVCAIQGILSYQHINDTLNINQVGINELIRELGV